MLSYKSAKSSEMLLSQSIIQALDINRFFYFHPANEGKRTLWEQRQYKLNGGKAGVPDLIIVLRSEIVFVELKTEKGRLSEVQKEFKEQIEHRNHRFEIWRSLEDALKFIMEEKWRR